MNDRPSAGRGGIKETDVRNRCFRLAVLVMVLGGLAAPRPAAAAPGRVAGTPAPLTGRIAYMESGNIWWLDLAGGRRTQITKDGQSDNPAWSPDGQWLAYDTRVGEQRDVRMVHPDGTGLTRITDTPGDEHAPTFAPDGTLYYIRQLPDPAPKALADAVVRHDPSAGDQIVYTQQVYRCQTDRVSVAADGRLVLSVPCINEDRLLLVDPKTGQETTILESQGLCPSAATWLHTSPRFLYATTPCPEAAEERSNLVIYDPAATPAGQPAGADAPILGLDIAPDDAHWVYATANGIIIDTNGQKQTIAPEGIHPAWGVVPGSAAPSPVPVTPGPGATAMAASPTVVVPAPTASPITLPASPTGVPTLPPAATATSVPSPPAVPTTPPPATVGPMASATPVPPVPPAPGGTPPAWLLIALGGAALLGTGIAVGLLITRRSRG
ncbi:MAG TPA: hypothetical protein VM536_15120 [Chloroflexia bacterium]|nr:hypothetical protein [Chloroflexia bacterium]